MATRKVKVQKNLLGPSVVGIENLKPTVTMAAQTVCGALATFKDKDGKREWQMIATVLLPMAVGVYRKVRDVDWAAVGAEGRDLQLSEMNEAVQSVLEASDCINAEVKALVRDTFAYGLRAATEGKSLVDDGRDLIDRWKLIFA